MNTQLLLSVCLLAWAAHVVWCLPHDHHDHVHDQHNRTHAHERPADTPEAAPATPPGDEDPPRDKRQWFFSGPFPGPFPGPIPVPGPFPGPVPAPAPFPAPGPFPEPVPAPGPFPGPFPAPGPFPEPVPAPGPFPAPVSGPVPVPGPVPNPRPFMDGPSPSLRTRGQTGLSNNFPSGGVPLNELVRHQQLQEERWQHHDWLLHQHTRGQQTPDVIDSAAAGGHFPQPDMVDTGPQLRTRTSPPRPFQRPHPVQNYPNYPYPHPYSYYYPWRYGTGYF